MAFEELVSGMCGEADYQFKIEQAEEYIQGVELRIKELQSQKKNASEDDVFLKSSLPYTNARILTREIVDLLIQSIYICSNTSIEIIWKFEDEYERLLAKLLTDCGIPAQTGKSRWQTTAVGYILQDEKYIADAAEEQQIFCCVFRHRDSLPALLFSVFHDRSSPVSSSYHNCEKSLLKSDFLGKQKPAMISWLVLFIYYVA